MAIDLSFPPVKGFENGLVIEGAPDDAKPEAVLEELKRAGYPTSALEAEVKVGGMSTGEKFGAGVRSSATDLARGAKQVLGDARPSQDYSPAGIIARGLRGVGLDSAADKVASVGNEMSKTVAEPGTPEFERQVAESRAVQATPAGAAGRLAGDVGILAPIGGAAGVVRGAARGALTGGAYAGLQPVVGDESRVENAALGGALGGLGGALAGHLSSPSAIGEQAAANAAARQAEVDALRTYGIQPTAAQIAGPRAAAVERNVGGLLTGPAQERVKAQLADALARNPEIASAAPALVRDIQAQPIAAVRAIGSVADAVSSVIPGGGKALPVVADVLGGNGAFTGSAVARALANTAPVQQALGNAATGAGSAARGAVNVGRGLLSGAPNAVIGAFPATAASGGLLAQNADRDEAGAAMQAPSGSLTTGKPSEPQSDLRHLPAIEGEAVPAGGGKLSLAERRNNPGNIRPAGSDTEFRGFEKIEDGMAEQMKLLRKYAANGRDTVESIVSRWSPATGRGNSQSSTDSYVASVSKRLGVEPGEHLDLDDPQTLASLAEAMSRVESGKNRSLWSTRQWDKALQKVFNS